MPYCQDPSIHLLLWSWWNSWRFSPASSDRSVQLVSAPVHFSHVSHGCSYNMHPGIFHMTRTHRCSSRGQIYGTLMLQDKSLSLKSLFMLSLSLHFNSLKRPLNIHWTAERAVHWSRILCLPPFTFWWISLTHSVIKTLRQHLRWETLTSFISRS